MANQDAASDDAQPLRRVPEGGFVADEEFGPQPTPRDELPDPEALLRTLGHCVFEAFYGARELEQVARWVTDDTYFHLEKRVALAARARRAKSLPALRPVFALGAVHLTEPADGVVEAVVMIHQQVRSRAIAIRLEGFDARWRASALHIL